MIKLLKVSAGLALATASALLLAGCAASEPAAAPAESTPAATAPAQTEAPATSPTQGANSDEEPKGSILSEQQIVDTLSHWISTASRANSRRLTSWAHRLSFRQSLVAEAKSRL